MVTPIPATTTAKIASDAITRRALIYLHLLRLHHDAADTHTDLAVSRRCTDGIERTLEAC